MSLLYNIGIFFLGSSIRVLSLFNPKAKKWVRGRRNFFSRLPEIDHSKQLIWFHCASLGEFDQGLPLMTELKKKNPEFILLVTFFSPSGMEHYHKRQHCVDLVLYLPLDTVKNAHRFVQYFRPSKTFFVKYEFWSNYVTELKRFHSKVYNVSGNFRNDQRFFKWYGRHFRKTLQLFDHFFVQNEKSKELLKGIGITRVTVSGDSRYDKVQETKKRLKPNEKLAAFCAGEKVFIVGSCWPADEQIVLPVVNAMKGKVIIAPHNIENKNMENIEKQLSRTSVRYTAFNEQDSGDYAILILDTIGHLSAAYSYGKTAYVGGGFSGNLHNILEPAVFGLPVIFGPKHERFPEGKQFIESGFGFSVSTTDELRNALETIEKDYAALSQKESAFMESKAGVSTKILEELTSS